MPVVGPLQTIFFLRDLESEVVKKVENCTTETDRVDAWLRDALIEISANPDVRQDFVELEATGPVFNLTVGTQEYPVSQFVPIVQGSPVDFLMGTLDVLLWTDYPTNKLRRKLKPSHFQESDKVSNSFPAVPAEWYRFGQNIGFNRVPDKTYQVQTRYAKRHPINDAVLRDTVVMLNREWNEVIVWAAAERGFAEKLEFEKAQAIHMLLFGDPKKPDSPGLVKRVLMTRQREAWKEEQPLRPVVRGYTYGSGI